MRPRPLLCALLTSTCLIGVAKAQLSSPTTIQDTNSAPFQGVVQLVPGTAIAAQRSVGFICTSSGPVTLSLVDGSSIVLQLNASTSFQTLPFAVTKVTLGTGTAGTFWNLK